MVYTNLKKFIASGAVTFEPNAGDYKVTKMLAIISQRPLYLIGHSFCSNICSKLQHHTCRIINKPTDAPMITISKFAGDETDINGYMRQNLWSSSFIRWQSSRSKASFKGVHCSTRLKISKLESTKHADLLKLAEHRNRAKFVLLTSLVKCLS